MKQLGIPTEVDDLIEESSTATVMFASGTGYVHCAVRLEGGKNTINFDLNMPFNVETSSDDEMPKATAEAINELINKLTLARNRLLQQAIKPKSAF